MYDLRLNTLGSSKRYEIFQKKKNVFFNLFSSSTKTELFRNAAQIEFLLGFLSIAYSILYYSCRGLFLFHFNWTVHCCSLIQFHSPSIYLKTCSAGKSTWNWAAEWLGAEVSSIRLHLTENITIEKIISEKMWLAASKGLGHKMTRGKN